jgi:hypothetical protein
MPRRPLLTATERTALLAFPTEAGITGSGSPCTCRVSASLAMPCQPMSRRRRRSWRGSRASSKSMRACGYGTPAGPPHAGNTCRSLYDWLRLTPFGVRQFRASVQQLTGLALQTDRGMALATALVEHLRQERVLLPPIDVIERACAVARTRGLRRLYTALTEPLTPEQRAAIEQLLQPRAATTLSTLTWLRQPPGLPNAKHILEHLARLRALHGLGLPDQLEQTVHHGVGIAVEQKPTLRAARQVGILPELAA